MDYFLKTGLFVVCLFSLSCSHHSTAVSNEASPDRSANTARASQQEIVNLGGQAKKHILIGHYQTYCHNGDFEQNLKTVVQGLELAAEANLDILSFPESILTGYFSTEAETRANSFSMDSPQIKKLLSQTAHFETLYMVGFNESRGDELHNTVIVIDRGRIVGCYSKVFPVSGYYVPGREFPVFEKCGLRFGIVICADAGYVEPCRILALKGANVIFAPHYNFVTDPVNLYIRMRNRHIARANENRVYFVRGNNVVKGHEVKGLDYYGYGCGDSYIVDPLGQIVAAAGINREHLMIYNLTLDDLPKRPPWRAVKSSKALLDIWVETVKSLD